MIQCDFPERREVPEQIARVSILTAQPVSSATYIRSQDCLSFLLIKWGITIVLGFPQSCSN
jgi:hypothetical protein